MKLIFKTVIFFLFLLFILILYFLNFNSLTRNIRHYDQFMNLWSLTENASKKNRKEMREIIIDEDLFRRFEKTKLEKDSERFIDLQEIARAAELERKANRKDWIRWNPTLGDIFGIRFRKNKTLWDEFHLRMARDELYPRNDKVLDALLKHASTVPIVNAVPKSGGTQFKLTLHFEDGGLALFKPVRFSQNFTTKPNHFVFNDIERHTAEIAAFHLDRLLGFRHVVPSVGRKVNVTGDIYKFADDEFLQTFYVSPDKNVCFFGKCKQYCDSKYGICGNPDMIEGSVNVFLPGHQYSKINYILNPWRGTYYTRRKTQWEIDENYCELVKSLHPYTSGRRLLDMVDMSVFDFLCGNWDRHSYNIFTVFGDDSAMVLFDHGRTFGKPHEDLYSALAPLIQCCVVRHTTVLKLLSFHNDIPLSERMKKSLFEDPLFPVLTEPHLKALDRRVPYILAEIRKCISNSKDPSDVIKVNMLN